MFRKTTMVLSAALIAMPISIAQAGERYSTPPAIVLSQDLTSNWTLQLRNKPAQPQQPRTTTRKKINLFARQKKQQVRRQRKNRSRPTGIFALWDTNAQRSTQQRVQRTKKKKLTYNQVTPKATASQSAAYIQKQAAQRPFDPRFLPRTVAYQTNQKPGSVIINTQTRYLYLVLDNGKARRYGVGVGKAGFEWSGTEKISRKSEWPSWRPPAEMIVRERKKGRELPVFMEGGPANPLGARALYLGSTLYRIHGTNQPWTIGQAVSSGCIRMRNEDVMELYERARIGAKVIVT